MNLFAEHKPRAAEAAPIPGLTIREAREADLGELSEIAAEREGKSAGSLRDGFERLLLETVPAAEGLVLVAQADRVLLGLGKVARFRHDTVSLVTADLAPEGWYLAGVIVRPEWRRRGIGDRLTSARLEWISSRADRAYYFVNARNTVSIDLHRRFGFIEVTRRFSFPGATFTGREGVLFAVDLKQSRSWGSSTCSGAS